LPSVASLSEGEGGENLSLHKQGPASATNWKKRKGRSVKGRRGATCFAVSVTSSHIQLLEGAQVKRKSVSVRKHENWVPTKIKGKDQAFPPEIFS